MRQYHLDEEIFNLLQQGEITGIYLLLQDIINRIVVDRDDLDSCERFFNMVSTIPFHESRVRSIVQAEKRWDEKSLYLGNSSLLVLRK